MENRLAPTAANTTHRSRLCLQPLHDRQPVLLECSRCSFARPSLARRRLRYRCRDEKWFQEHTPTTAAVAARPDCGESLLQLHSSLREQRLAAAAQLRSELAQRAAVCTSLELQCLHVRF